MYVILKCYKDDNMVLICLKNIRLVEYSLWFCLNKKEYKVQNGYYIDDYSIIVRIMYLIQLSVSLFEKRCVFKVYWSFFLQKGFKYK